MRNYDIFKRRKGAAHRVLCGFLALTCFSTWALPPGYAQLIPQALLDLPAPGVMVTPGPAFTPAIINGITIHPENPLEFDFIIGTGDDKLAGKAFEEESTRLIKYFLAALTVPEEEMWVNLSPYEKDRIIPEGFGTTEMGRDLLAQDYILKQLTASLMYPEKELGSEFWKKIYQKAYEQYGTTEIPVNTFNKVWIVPEEAVVYENGSSAFVVKSRLKVMLEEDYDALRNEMSSARPRADFRSDREAGDEASAQGKSLVSMGQTKETRDGFNSPQVTQVIREVLIPAIEVEVNEGRSFASLRQIYNSAILAAWFKQNLKETLLGQVYVDKSKTKGVDVEDKTVNQKIYGQYLEAFKKGVYNYIKEDYDPATREVIPRKYFSGGTNLTVGGLVETYKQGQRLTRPQQEVLGEYFAGLKADKRGQQKVNVNLVELSEETSVADAREAIRQAAAGKQEQTEAKKVSSPVLTPAEREHLPESVLANIDGGIIYEQPHIDMVRLLIEIGEGGLMRGWDIPGINDQKKKEFLNQVDHLNRSYPGGLRAYKSNAREKLKIVLDNLNPFEGFTPHVPVVDDLTKLDEQFLKLSREGLKAANKTAFALVAGGLGERLGYKSGVKVEMPLDLIALKSYLQFFAEHILAIQHKSNRINGEGRIIPLAIMTSDDTHEKTIKFLEENNYFGMDGLSVIDISKERVVTDADGQARIVDTVTSEDKGNVRQIIIFKQESVPIVRVEYDAGFVLQEGSPYALQVKPHNHGDIHILMRKSGLAEAWQKDGRTHTIFFQDTNGQVFNAILPGLGNSIRKNYKMNFLTVARDPGSNVGAIAFMTRDGKSMVRNIEYSELDRFLRASARERGEEEKGDVADATGYSPFPGNMNVFILENKSYVEKLKETGGIFAEIVNAKQGATTTRLEAPMQDVSEYLPPGDVGTTTFEPRFAFAAVKNELKKAVQAVKKGTYPESMAPAEGHSFKIRRLYFYLAGVDVNVGGQEKISLGIPYIDGAKISYSPEFAVTPQEVQQKITGGMISDRSVVVIDGEDIHFENVNVDGTLIIKTAPGINLRVHDLNVKNGGWEYVDLSNWELANPETPEHLKMRGYKLVKHDQLVFDLRGYEAGNYEIGADGRIIRSSSSPVQEAVKEIARHEVPGILRQMDEVYGLTKEQAAGLTNNPFARIGFDGDANRMGWTVNYLKEILQNPAMLQQTLKDAENIRNNYENVVFIGMGGSGLGVEVIKSTFGKKTGPRIFSLRTTDPATIDELIKQIAELAGGDLKTALERTKFVVISKTFTTQEVLFNRDYFEKSYQDVGIENVSRHFMLVTDPGSQLDAAAAQQTGYEVRYIQLNKKTDIGGRNTTFTNINLLPLAILAPEKVIPFLQEALRMNQKESVEEDVFAMLGVYLHYMATGYSARKDKVTFIVPEELRALPMWSEQLIEESLGKDGKGISVIYGEGLTAQKLRDPVFTKDRVFLRFNLGGQLTRPDLAEALSGREDVIDIDFRSVDQIGALMLGLQRAVAVIAYRWNTNFVNQPGVEGYKRETREVLASIKDGQRVDVPYSWRYGAFNQLKIYYTPFIEAGIITKKDLEREVAELGSDLSDGAAVYAALINIARKTGKFELAEIASYGHMNPAVWSVMQKARTDILTDLLKVASKLGEGPDRNHSFHQSVEQGPDYHLSTYLMPLETPQPPHREYDVNPLRAQTIGTVKSLISAHRKVVLMTIEGRIADSQPVLKEFFDRVHSLLRRDKALEQSSSPSDVTGMEGRQRASSPAVKIKEGAELITLSDKEGAFGVEFGTNGVRAPMYKVDEQGQKIAEGPFTTRFVSRVAAAIARAALGQIRTGGRVLLDAQKGLRILVAYDGRQGAEDFARAAYEAIAALEGMRVDLADGITNSPDAAFQSAKNYDFVIQITASHNPENDNGIKLFTEGMVAPDQLAGWVEKEANSPEGRKNYYIRKSDAGSVTTRNAYAASSERKKDAFPQLMALVEAYRRVNPAAAMVVDLFGGAASRYAGEFEGLGIRVVRSQPMSRVPYRNNKGGLYAPNPTLRENYGPEFDVFIKDAPEGSVYFGLDGDVDRLVVWTKVDGQVKEIKPNDLGMIYADYLLSHPERLGVSLEGKKLVIAKTLPTSLGLNWVARKHNIEIYEVPVGSKNFRSLLENPGYIVVVATEESGHQIVTVGGETFFDDAVTQMYLVLEMMGTLQKNPAMIVRGLREKIGFDLDFDNTAVKLTPAIVDAFIGQMTTNPQAIVDRIESALGKKAESVKVISKNNQVEAFLPGVTVLKPDQGLHLLFKDSRLGTLAWVYFRKSGTEPIIRIYRESAGKNVDLLELGRQAIGSSPAQAHEIDVVDLSSPQAREEFEQVSRDALYFWAKAQKGDKRIMDALHFLEETRLLAEKNSAGRLYLLKIREGKVLVPAGMAVVDAKEDPRGGMRVEVDISAAGVTDEAVRDFILKIVKDHSSAKGIYFHPEIPKGKDGKDDTSSLVRLLQAGLDFKNVGSGDFLYLRDSTKASSPVDVARLIMDLRDSPDEGKRIAAARELGGVSPTTDRIFEALKLALTRKGETVPVRQAAALVLGEIGTEQAREILAEAKAHANGDIRTAVLEAEKIASSPTTEDDGGLGSVEKTDLYDNIISGTYPVLPEEKTKKKDVGGIDLNPALFDLQIKRDADGVPLPLPQQPIEQMNIEGFIPVIINITPVTSLPLLLGLAETGGEAEETMPAMKAREPEEMSALN